MRTRPEMTAEQVELTLLALPSFAERLDWLVSHVVRPDFSEDELGAGSRRSPHYTLTQVAEAIGGTQAYVSKLRAGTSSNPGIDVVRQLAHLFEVDPGLLIPPWGGGQLPDQERTRTTLRVAARVARLPHSAAVALDSMVAQFVPLDQPPDKQDRRQ